MFSKQPFYYIHPHRKNHLIFNMCKNIILFVVKYKVIRFVLKRRVYMKRNFLTISSEVLRKATLLSASISANTKCAYIFHNPLKPDSLKKLKHH